MVRYTWGGPTLGKMYQMWLFCRIDNSRSFVRWIFICDCLSLVNQYYLTECESVMVGKGFAFMVKRICPNAELWA